MKISTVLDQIDLGAIALPEFQRGYVWNRDQVRGLMQSLYRRYPVGGLLVWVTKSEGATTRGNQPAAPGVVNLLLDGQQRVTSLYGIVRGVPPRFFDGHPQVFSGLNFHVGDEVFEFYSAGKMRDDPLWVDVTRLMKEGVAPFTDAYLKSPAHIAKAAHFMSRLNTLQGIRDIELHVEQVSGVDKTLDVVVDIFNRVNSGGTKLSKGDLALAKVCAAWPEARGEMKRRIEKWNKAGFSFRQELLLRCINAILTGEALFTALEHIDTPKFKEGLKRTEKRIDAALNLIASRLGLDHDRVLGGRYALPLMTRYIDVQKNGVLDHKERDHLLYWYVHAFLWGRYSVSTESTLKKDLELIKEPKEALDRLIGALRQDRGDLRVRADDFGGWNRGARFYPLLYLLTRVSGSSDFGSGNELTSHLLGKGSALNIHHVFPRAKLKKIKIPRNERNALANFTFLTAETNIALSDNDPAEYLPRVAAQHPGALESHWIPMDRSLWRIERYSDFLAARRELLADAANRFLDSLAQGTIPDRRVALDVEERSGILASVGGVRDEEEATRLEKLRRWLERRNLPLGEIDFEVVEANTDSLVVVDLAWPDGLQAGLSEPVALMLDEDDESVATAARAGMRVYTSVSRLRSYVRNEILAGEDELTANELPAALAAAP